MSLYLAIHLAAAVAFFPLVGPAALRWGKKRVYTLAYLGLAVWFPLLMVVGRLPAGFSPAWQAAVFMGVAGAILSFHYVLPGAMIAQAIDHDAERTGLRREAMYFGTQGILQKAAMGLSGLLLAALLRWGGYEAAHPLGIYLVGPAAGLMFLGGYFSLRRWNLTD